MINDRKIKEAIDVLRYDNNEKNFLYMLKTLKNSNIIIPCNAILSKEDEKRVDKMMEESNGNIEGKTITNLDDIDLVADILTNDNNEFYFPVFTSEKEMGEYGNSMTKVENSFVEAIELAKKTNQKINGIIVNAFTDQLTLGFDIIDLISTL